MFHLILCLVILRVNAKDGEKIFGGRLAKKGEFPFIVGIASQIFCGGTLVTLSKVLSAGHCFLSESLVPAEVEEFTIYGGSTIMQFREEVKDESRQERKISKIKIHEKYYSDDFNYYNDIGLAFLVKPFTPSETLRVATFPSRDAKKFEEKWKEVVSSGRTCLALGWGTTMMLPDETGNPKPSVKSQDLKALDLIPLADEKCNKMNLDTIGVDWLKHKAPGEVCLGDAKSGESPCNGDSGSPLVCDGFVFAYIRGRQECGNKSFPSFYILYGPFFDYFDLQTPTHPTHDETPGSSFTLHTFSWLSVIILLKNMFKN